MAYASSSESGSKHLRQIHSTGVTELYVPDSPVLDVCFVHGFTGHPELTWRSKKRSKRQAPSESVLDTPSKRKRFGFLPSPRTSSSRESSSAERTTATGEYPYWPRDLVPQIIPDARVLTFGYDTHIRHSVSRPPSQNRLIDHGSDFLCALEDCRRLDPSRPLLFIAHSLGGLVVKETLRQSKSYEQEQPDRALIYLRTAGIIFFGTPHAGADPLNGIHHSLVRLVKALGWRVNDQVVQTLMPNAERLVMLSEEFLSMVHARCWQIHSFQEEFPQTGLFGKKVVEDSSSRINDRQYERTTHIQANHVDMCRFDGLEDPEFRKVQAALQFMQNSVRERSALVTSTLHDHHLAGSVSPSLQTSLTPEQKENILDKLKFDAVDSRYVSLRAAQTKTCQWLPKSKTYKAWQDATKLAEHHGFLWIKGKPGAGKSIMMKFLLQKAKRMMTGSLVISFFFNARGDKLEKSTEGLYRSLLIQLLQSLSGNPLDAGALVPLLAMPEDSPWPIEALKSAFESVISQAGTISLCCYIDALDECSEDEVREMIYFFEDIGEQALGSNFIFRVCFSSRHYPHITIRKGLQLTLEAEPDHTNDIRQYIQSKLKIKEQDKKQKIETEVLERSANIFLWAALVVDILNKEYDKGLNPTLKRLKQIPDGLHRLFEDILTRDDENIDELVLCLQWILFAKRPLRPEELYFAVQLGLDPAKPSRWDQDNTGSDMIDRFNLNVSKGLTEVTKKKSTVQFIHESVRDYLLRDDGLRTLLQHRKDMTGDVEGFSNETLKETCLAQLGDQTESEIPIPDKLTKASSPEETSLREETKAKFPFLEYAVNHVLSHADSAQKCGIDQTGFLSTFSCERWITFDNLLQKHQTRRHDSDAPLIYLLAEHNSANLIQLHPQRHLGLTLSTEFERYNLPIAAALALGNHDAIRMLAIEAAKHSIGPGGDALISKIRAELTDLSRFKSNRNGDQWKDLDAQTSITLLGSISLVDALWDTSMLSLRDDTRSCINLLRNFPSVDFAKRLICYQGFVNDIVDEGSALTNAAKTDTVELAEYFLSQNADPNLKDMERNAPLYYAKSVEMARTLYQHGANPYDISSDEGSFLHCLAERKTPDALPLMEYALGEMGIPIDTTTRSGRTPLSMAVTGGSIKIVQFLLNSDKAAIDLADDEGRTPLSYAAGADRTAVVKYLLKLGAQPHFPDKSCRTPIFHAANLIRYSGFVARAVEALLDQPSTDPNYADINGLTPLSQAAFWNHTDILRLLLKDARIDPAIKCKKGRTVISHVDPYRSGESSLALLLKMTSVDPDEPDFGGKTPLMYACEEWSYRKIEELLRSGKVDVNAKDNLGWTPLWHIIKNWHDRASWRSTDGGVRSIRQLLASNIVDPLVIVDGYTPLDFAKSELCPARGNKEWPDVVEVLSSYVEKWNASRGNAGDT